MIYTQQDVQDNLGLVHMVAQKYAHQLRHPLNEYDDLISSGTLGLMHALERFDPDRGYKFSSFAVRCIWGFMMRNNRNLFMEQYKAKESRYDVPSYTMSLYRTSNSKESDDGDPRELTLVRGADDKGKLMRQLEARSERAARRELVEKPLGLADDRERVIVIMLFGLDGEGKRTLRQIGEHMGISHERCRQLKERFFRKVREEVA